MISSNLHEEIPHFVCEICGTKLDCNKMNDLFIFARGNIGNDLRQNMAFNELTQRIYIHKQCMKILINKKFSNILQDSYSNLL
ncbi:MAG: hypothetical protein ACFFBP_17860 [Promethearchaeota archaeon]